MIRMSRIWHAVGALLVLGLVSGCQTTTEPASLSASDQRAPDLSAQARPSAESVSAARYYRRIEADQVARGLMRIDGGGPDVRFDALDLTRNFERIALFNEYVQVGGRFVARESSAQLRRWEAPVRIKLHFGASAQGEMEAQDTAFVRRYVARLARATRHPITLVDDERRANYHVFVVSLDEQRQLGPKLKRLEPGLANSTIREMEWLPRSNYCAVYASSTAATPFTYGSAIAIVRSEHPDLMREACYHEEIAQGLGLANDSPEARPSIFNDDEEFAFLTTHDETLLSMLYDRRLRPGMTAEQARPIIRKLARERAPGAV